MSAPAENPLVKQVDEVATESGIDPLTRAGDVARLIVDRLTPSGWEWVAKGAGVNPPGPKTIKLIRETYLERERIADRVKPSNVYQLRPNRVERVR